MNTGAAWTHYSIINGEEELNPSNPLWVCQCIMIRDVNPCPGPYLYKYSLMTNFKSLVLVV